MAKTKTYKQRYAFDSKGASVIAGAILFAFIAIAIIEEKNRLP